MHAYFAISLSNRLACSRFIWKKNIPNSSTDRQNENEQKLPHSMNIGTHHSSQWTWSLALASFASRLLNLLALS